MVAPPRPAPTPRRQRPGADLGALVRAGIATPPPAPKPRASSRTQGGQATPAAPVPDSGHVDTLQAALRAEGVPATAGTETAVRQVATLDTATVDRVVAWIQHVPATSVPTK